MGFDAKAELTNNKIPYNISSAYRNYKQQAGLATTQKESAAPAGSSPHGWGGAVDFGNLNRDIENIPKLGWDEIPTIYVANKFI